jgi:hypothetical protein
MRLRDNIARKIRPLILGALSALFLLPLATQVVARQIMVKPDDVRKQLSQPVSPAPGATQVQTKPAASPALPKPPVKPASAATQSTPKPGPKPAVALKQATPAAAQKSAISTKASVPVDKTAQVQKVDAKKVGGAELTPVADHPVGPRRDPFDPLVGKEKVGPVPENLPPGKAGLQITTLRLDGVVRSPNGMIAVVSNPQQRVYFLRDGDRLYDGQVEHITLEGLSFHQAGTDPFGKPVEREVTKQLYPTPGELK